MTCRELIEFLDDYRAGAQPPEVRQTFEQHLSICAHCRSYLRTFEDAVRMGREAMTRDEATVPAGVPEDFVRAVMMAMGARQAKDSAGSAN